MMTEIQKKIKDEFLKFEDKLNGQKVCKYHQVRKKAMDDFIEKGLPTLKNEDWKYTNVSFINKIDFDFPDSELPDIEPEIIENLSFKGLDCYKLVMINGKLSEKYSDNISSEGIDVLSLKKALETKPNIVEKDLGMHLNYKGHAFAAINTAFAYDGLYIEVADNFHLDKPIHLININDSREKAIFTNPRKLIKTGIATDLVLLETTHVLGNNPGINNTAAEILVGKNSHVDYYKIQDDSESSINFNSTQAVQEQDSSYNDNTITLQGKFVRNSLYALQNGSNCETYFNGFFYIDGNQFADNHSFMDHAVANCNSDENYKGILDEKGHGVFNGKILVRKDAQKINAYQSNKNILLSDLATINTKPELEIYADDVKCSHGATSGNINTDELFYLKARGIEENQAKALLLKAFASEIIMRIKLPEVQEIISEKIEKRLEKKLANRI